MLPVPEQPAASETVTVYVPEIGVDNTGFWVVEVNPFGPLHVKLVPPCADRETLTPVQTGLLLLTTGTNCDATVTEVDAVPVQPLISVAVTV